jgi:hypothetical protein
MCDAIILLAGIKFASSKDFVEVSGHLLICGLSFFGRQRKGGRGGRQVELTTLSTIDNTHRKGDIAILSSLFNNKKIRLERGRGRGSGTYGGLVDGASSPG